MTAPLEVRPHGANCTLGALPAHSFSEALRLQNVFGGDVVDSAQGWHYCRNAVETLATRESE